MCGSFKAGMHRHSNDSVRPTISVFLVSRRASTFRIDGQILSSTSSLSTRTQMQPRRYRSCTTAQNGPSKTYNVFQVLFMCAAEDAAS